MPNDLRDLTQLLQHTLHKREHQRMGLGRIPYGTLAEVGAEWTLQAGAPAAALMVCSLQPIRSMVSNR